MPSGISSFSEPAPCNGNSSCMWFDTGARSEGARIEGCRSLISHNTPQAHNLMVQLLPTLPHSEVLAFATPSGTKTKNLWSKYRPRMVCKLGRREGLTVTVLTLSRPKVDILKTSRENIPQLYTMFCLNPLIKKHLMQNAPCPNYCGES